MADDNRRYDIGDVVTIDGEEQEIVAVSYGENVESGERERFTYQFRNKQELEDEREAQRKADEEREAAEAERLAAENGSPTEPTEEDIAEDLANEEDSTATPQ